MAHGAETSNDSTFNRWQTAFANISRNWLPVSYFSRDSVKNIEIGPVDLSWQYRYMKRTFLSDIDQRLFEISRDSFELPREQKLAKV